MVESDVMESKSIDGRDDGIKQGEKKREKEIARMMKNDNQPLATIAKCTGLSTEEIELL